MSSYHILSAIWVGVFPMIAVAFFVVLLVYILCCLKRLGAGIRESRSSKFNSITTNNEPIVRLNRYQPSPQPSPQPLASIIPYNKAPASILKTSKLAKSLNNMSTDAEKMEQIEVQELNESPKSLYSKYKSLERIKFKEDKKSNNDTDINSSKNDENATCKQPKSIMKTPTGSVRRCPRRIPNELASSTSSSDGDESSSIFRMSTRKTSNLAFNEDDFIFNDEDDTLSSTGICENQNGDLLSIVSAKSSNRANSMRHLNVAVPSHVIRSSSSLTSIDPDENILNDILVKSNTKLNKVHI